MPKLAWKNIETGADILPTTDLSRAEIDALIKDIEPGEEYGLKLANRPQINLVVLTIDTSNDVTTLSAQLV
jgi:hypothetical protein